MEKIALAVMLILCVVAFALAAWGALLERAEADAIEKRRLSRAAKLNRWGSRADWLLILTMIAMTLCLMIIAFVIFTD